MGQETQDELQGPGRTFLFLFRVLGYPVPKYGLCLAGAQ